MLRFVPTLPLTRKVSWLWGALGLIAYALVLAGSATAHAEDRAGKTGEAAPARLETRLQDLADKHTIAERALRDRAGIVAQITRLEAHRSKLLERFMPTHPSVLQIDRQLRILRQQLAEAEAAPATTAPPAP